MKKIFALIPIYLWIISFCFSSYAQEFKSVQDGVEYAEITREIDQIPVKMNLLRLDLTKVRLDVVHALDTAIGLEKTSSMAARYGAIAAVNAGFFRIDRSIYEGDDVSALMINGKLLSENPNNRIALFVENGTTATTVGIGRFNPSLKLTARKLSLPISGINRERKADELIAYTPEFHLTTLTDTDGVEIIVIDGKIAQILSEKGSSRIPGNGLVLSATGKSREAIRSLKIGDKISVESEPASLADFGMRNVEDIVSGVPQLIKDGKIDITWQEEKSSKSFVETKHPRTAVAKLKDGKFLMVTIDGRSESSGGIGLQHLAELLLELGATDAMNLDGGGSTTMFLGGRIVNNPSDKEGERRVGDAILVFPRAKNN